MRCRSSRRASAMPRKVARPLDRSQAQAHHLLRADRGSRPYPLRAPPVRLVPGADPQGQRELERQEGDRADHAGRDQQPQRGRAGVLHPRARGAQQGDMEAAQGARRAQIHARRADRSRPRRIRPRTSRASSISPSSRRNSRSMSIRSRRAISTGWRNSMRCGSGRPPRSTTSPIASPGVPSRKACRSSTIRNR